MAISPGEPHVARLSTHERSVDERTSTLRRLYESPDVGRVFPRIDLAPSPDHPFHCDMMFRALSGLNLAKVACSNARADYVRQDQRHADLSLNLTLSGRRAVTHCRREVEISDGEALLSTGAEPLQAQFSQTRFFSLRVPFAPIAAMVSNLEQRLCRPIRRDAEAMPLLISYVDTLLRDDLELTTPIQRSAATHVYDLLALALGATRDAAEVANLRGARAARLAAIKQDIRRNLSRESLSVAVVAARHRLQVRYVQRLFEAEGMTFTGFLLAERLARARRMLSDPRLIDRPVGLIAYEVGFDNHSYFDRAFRRQFGMSPSDVRAQARSEDERS